MDSTLYYIRDNLVGIHYFIYSFILLFFMFSIIGYLFKKKYAKYDIKLNTSQKKVNDKKEVNAKDKKINNTSKDNASLKVNETVSVKESALSKEIKKVVPSQVNTVNPVPTPSPVTKDIKKPVVIPAKPEPTVANPVSNDMKNKGTIPEL